MGVRVRVRVSVRLGMRVKVRIRVRDRGRDITGIPTWLGRDGSGGGVGVGGVTSALSSWLWLLGSVFSALSSRLCLLGSVFSALSVGLLGSVEPIRCQSEGWVGTKT